MLANAEDGGEAEEFEIDLNDAEPTFLQGVSSRSGIEMSPIKIVKNPDGTMQRAAMTQVGWCHDVWQLCMMCSCALVDVHHLLVHSKQKAVHSVQLCTGGWVLSAVHVCVWTVLGMSGAYTEQSQRRWRWHPPDLLVNAHGPLFGHSCFVCDRQSFHSQP